MRFSKILAMLCLSLPAIGFAESDTQINSNVVSTEINADTTIKKGCFSAFGPNRRRGPTGPRGPRGPAGATGATGGSFAPSTVSLYIDTGGGQLVIDGGTSIIPRFNPNVASPDSTYNIVTDTTIGSAVYLDPDTGVITLNAVGNFLVSYQAYPFINNYTQLYLTLNNITIPGSVTALQGYSQDPPVVMIGERTCVVNNTTPGSVLDLISSRDFSLNNPPYGAGDPTPVPTNLPIRLPLLSFTITYLGAN